MVNCLKINLNHIKEVIRICLIQDIEADFLWKVSLKILNSGIIMKPFTLALHRQKGDGCKQSTPISIEHNWHYSILRKLIFRLINNLQPVTFLINRRCQIISFKWTLPGIHGPLCHLLMYFGQVAFIAYHMSPDPTTNGAKTFVVCQKPLQTVRTQIRPDVKSSLIWVQTVWHSTGIPERIFWKCYFWKNQQSTKKCTKLPSIQRVKL